MKRHISLYILAVLLPLVGWAQERRMLSLPNLEQLSSKHILEVMQDSEGFLWYATQGGGVCRDDGRQMMVFRSDAEHPDLRDVLFQPTKEQLEKVPYPDFWEMQERGRKYQEFLPPYSKEDVIREMKARGQYRTTGWIL